MAGYEIVRVRLKNFDHFSTSLGLDDFEIDRRGSKNNIVLLVGGNGSGKSLLMSNWTPNVTEPTNNRKKPLIVPDKEGLKEVDIISTDENDIRSDYMYKCRIVYGHTSTNCSLIKYDTVTGESIELNPNGLVRSYESKLEEIFGIKKTYKNIGYLSPQVTSLVAMTPSVRYEYISTWLPDITQYMEAYKIVFKRINSINRQIKMLENDIGNISIENITRDKNLILSQIDTTSKNIEENKTKYIKLSMVRDNLLDVSREFITTTIATLIHNKKILDSDYIRLNKLKENSAKYYGKNGDTLLITDIATCESNISLTNSRLNDISKTIDNNRLKMKEYEYKLGLLDDTEDSLPELSAMIERMQSSIDVSNSVIDNYKNNFEYLQDISDTMTINEYNVVNNTIESIQDIIYSIIEAVPNSKLDNISEYASINDTSIKLLFSKLREIDDSISSNLQRISLLRNSPLDPSILDLRSSICNDDGCGILKEISRLLSPDIEVNNLTEKIEGLYVEKSKIQEDIDKISEESNELCRVIGYLNDMNHIIMRDKHYISYLPNKIVSILSSKNSDIINNISLICKHMVTIGEYISIRDQYKLYKEEIVSLKNKESSLLIVRNMNSDVKELGETIDILISERRQLMIEGELLLKKYDELKELKESINNISLEIDQYNTITKKHIQDQEKMRSICKDWYYRNLLTKATTKLDIMIKTDENILNELRSRLETIHNTIITKTSLIEMRDRLLKNIKELDILQSAWNPKSGIPSLFISNFLTRIHSRSNDHLESLNGNELTIDKFEIGKTAREFPIIIKKDDNTIIDDASSCSEGQIALLSLGISLAMIHEIIGNKGYNILRIDELDAPLDHDRRKMYINMIQEKLKHINSKQCVIISHASEWDEVEADIILFPGAHKTPDSLKNKNILLDISDIKNI